MNPRDEFSVWLDAELAIEYTRDLLDQDERMDVKRIDTDDTDDTEDSDVEY